MDFWKNQSPLWECSRFLACSCHWTEFLNKTSIYLSNVLSTLGIWPSGSHQRLATDVAPPAHIFVVEKGGCYEPWLAPVQFTPFQAGVNFTDANCDLHWLCLLTLGVCTSAATRMAKTLSVDKARFTSRLLLLLQPQQCGTAVSLAMALLFAYYIFNIIICITTVPRGLSHGPGPRVLGTVQTHKRTLLDCLLAKGQTVEGDRSRNTFHFLFHGDFMFVPS